MSQLGDGLNATVRTTGAEVWRRWNDVFAPGVLALRISVPPSAAADAIEVLDRRFAGAAATLSSTLAAGVVRANLRPTGDQRASALVAHASDVAARFGGYAVVEAAPLSYKHDNDVFGPLRPDFAIMKRLKDEFDPRRTLSPGRFVGRL
jgi:glycolate oxidase FAD binding subunit